jgi:hypothetical protein
LGFGLWALGFGLWALGFGLWEDDVFVKALFDGITVRECVLKKRDRCSGVDLLTPDS